MATKQKWFYAAQAEVETELRKQYEHLNCQYQIVTKDRVIEYTKAQNPGTEADMLLISISKQGSHTSVLIHKTEYVQGWHEK